MADSAQEHLAVSTTYSDAQQVSDLPSNPSFANPLTVSYRGTSYTLSNPGQYEQLRNRLSAQEQSQALAQSRAATGHVDVTPTQTAQGSVTNVRGQLAPSGSQLVAGGQSAFLPQDVRESNATAADRRPSVVRSSASQEVGIGPPAAQQQNGILAALSRPGGPLAPGPVFGSQVVIQNGVMGRLGQSGAPLAPVPFGPAQPAANFETAQGKAVFVPPSGQFGRGKQDDGVGLFEQRVSKIEAEKSAAAQRNQNAADIFRAIPGLSGDNLLQSNTRAALALPARLVFGTAEQSYIAGLEIGAIAQGLSNKESRANTLSELGAAVPRAGKAVVSSYDPSSPEGLTNIGVTLLAVKATAGVGIVPRTTGPKGAIDIFTLSKGRYTVEGENTVLPVSPKSTVILKYDEGVSGPRGFLLGEKSKTTVRTNPSGSVTKVQVIGDTRYVTRQAPGASQAVVTEFRGGQATRTAVVKGFGPLPKATVEEVARGNVQRSGGNIADDIIAQQAKAGRVLSIDVGAGKGKSLMGFLEQSSEARSVTKAGPSTFRQGVIGLETVPVGKVAAFGGERGARSSVTAYGTRTEIVSEVTRPAQTFKTSLRIGSQEEVRGQERLSSSNRFVQGALSLQESGPLRESEVVYGNRELGTLTTFGEFSVRGRGKLYLESVGGIGAGVREKSGALFQKGLDNMDLADTTKGSPRGLFPKSSDTTETFTRPPSRKFTSTPSDTPVQTVTRAEARTGNVRYVPRIEAQDFAGRLPGRTITGSRTALLFPVVTPRVAQRSNQQYAPAEQSFLPPSQKPRQDQAQLPLQRPAQDTKPRQQTVPDLGSDTRQGSLSRFSFDSGNPSPPPSQGFGDVGGPAGPGWKIPDLNLGPTDGTARRFSFGQQSRSGANKLQYSASLVAQVFHVKGTARQAALGSATGLTVRPYVTRKS